MIRPAQRPTTGPFGRAAMFISVAFLLAGIVWPQAAEALLRMLLLTLVAGFVVGRAVRTLPARTTRDFYSPFAGDAPRPPPTAPRALRKLATELAAADNPRLARRTPVPWPVRRMVMGQAARRLAEQHGLRLGDPGHHAAIRPLVSELMWDLIDPRGRESRPGAHGTAVRGPVTVSQLDTILDELEGR